MLHQNKLFSIIILVAPFAVAAIATATTTNSAVASVRAADLCLSTGIDTRPDDDSIGRGGCEYAASDAPVLDVDVCWDGRTARLKGTAPCSDYTRTYHVQSGEVLDPLTGEIAAYAPLRNSCDLVSCAPSFQAAALEDGAACCDPNTGNCTATDVNGMCPVGDITWCKEIETNGDGSVTCHE